MTFLKHITQIMKPYRLQVLLGLALLFAITISQLVIPGIIKNVIDVGLVNKDLVVLRNAAFLVIAIGVARALLLFAQRYTSTWIAQKVAYDLRNRLYDHIQRLSFSYHDEAQTGQLISRCIEDVNATNQFTGFGIVELIRITVLLIGITILLFAQNWILALVTMLPMVPLLLLTTSFGQRISELFYRVDQAMGELSTRVQENVSGAQVIRAFAREDYEIERFARANREEYQTRIVVLSEFAKLFPTTQLLTAIGTILILGVGGWMVLEGQLTVGDIVAFNAYLLLMANPAQELAWLVNLAGEAKAGLNRIFEILDEKAEIQTPEKPQVLAKLEGRVEFRQVGLKYRPDAHEFALNNIQVDVKPNQIIALIGTTGSGKTSLVNLIPRFYDVSEGQVLIDGVDVRQLDLESLRKQIGIVLQTSLLFSDTVAANIAFGQPDASDEEIIAAAKAAQAHEFIMALPEGYNTIVGERGLTLSGGQRQRVAIARALLTNPRILILDDSTSSVDTETERLIQQALGELMQGRTTFVIAHRLSTVRRADMILVMDGGEIVQRGTHETLLTQEGVYREIYELQLKKQEEYAALTAAQAE